MASNKSYYIIRDYARHNRKNPTKAESFFWKKVRGKKLNGLKFLRQHIVEYKLYDYRANFFIADFCCYEHKLIIELDGRIHDYQNEYDQNRTEILEAMSLSVLRFTNDEVLNNWSIVHNKIIEFSTHP